MSKKLRRSPKSFHHYVRWQVDSDYLDKLSPEDREWMLKFQEAEYAGNGHLLYEDDDTKRRLWREQGHQRTDVMIYALYGHDGEPPGTQPSPEDALNALIDRQAEEEAEAAAEARKDRIKARLRKLDKIEAERLRLVRRKRRRRKKARLQQSS